MIGVVALLGVMAIPVASIRLGLPDGGSEATGTSAHTAYTTIADEFGPGVNGPIIAVATLPEQDTARTDAEVLDAQADIADRPDVGRRREQRAALRRERRHVHPRVPGRAHHRPGRPGHRRHREAIHFSADTYGRHTGTDIGLTGQTVANIEISAAARRRPCRPTSSSSSGSRSSS